MGRDTYEPHVRPSPSTFQSTRPHGARPTRTACRRQTILCFNPRARMGRDAQALGGAVREHVSIHAPAWGATWLERMGAEPPTKFQSTRPHGARRAVSHADSPSCSFNPRARMGRDHVIARRCIVLYLFQSTRPHGARPTLSMAPVAVFVFQSTRPHGARHAHAYLDALRQRVSIHAPAWGAT